MKFSFGSSLLLLASVLTLSPVLAQQTGIPVPVSSQPVGKPQARTVTVTTKKNGVVKRDVRTIRVASGTPFVPSSAHKAEVTPRSPHRSSIAVHAKAYVPSNPTAPSVRPRFGGPNGPTVNSVNFGSLQVSAAAVTMNLSYPAPGTDTTYSFALFGNVDFSLTNATCDGGSTCNATVSFSPVVPGLLRDAVSVTDQNGNVVYETFVYGNGVAPQFGYDFGGQSNYSPGGTPTGITVGPDGRFYIGDQSSDQVTVYSHDFSSSSSAGFTNLGKPFGVAVDGAGTIFVADQTNNAIASMTRAGVQASLPLSSALSGPQGIAIDGSGALFVCDTGNNRIVKIDNQGTETDLIDNVTSPQWIAVDALGDVYYADLGSGGEINELVAMSGSTTQIGNQLGQIQGLAVDAGGRVFYTTPSGFGAIDYGYGTSEFIQTSSTNQGPYGIVIENDGDITYTSPSSGSYTFGDRSSSNFILSTTPGSTTVGSDNAENTGNDVLTISSASIPGPVFTYDSTSTCVAGATLSAGQLCRFVVDFTPPDDHSYQEDLAIVSNSLYTDQTTDDFTVFGNGQGFTTSTTLSTSTGAALSGSSVTLTATVANTAGNSDVPTGSVTFTDNNNFLVTVSLPQGGTTASYTTSSLGTGANQIQATYSGDSLFSTSTSSIQNVQIDAMPIQTATSLQVSSANVTAGQPETLTAIVAGEYTAPTGTVTFSDQNGVLGTAATSGSGSGSNATLTLTTLSTGSHTITATYNGDATFTASTSSPQTVTVSAGITTTSALTVSSTTIAAEQPETLTITVTPAMVSGMQPDGSATFLDTNGSVIGTSYFTGYSPTSQLTTSSLTVGQHSITAVYSGDQTYAGSTSPAQTVTVTGTATTLTISPATTAYRTPVTFNINTAAHVGQAIVCSASALQCSAVSNLAIVQINSDGNASVKLPAGPVGTNSFIAKFLGTAATDGTSAVPGSTSAAATVTVTSTGAYPTTTALTASGTASPYSLTGTVVGVGSRTLAPTGQVTFNDTSNSSSPLLGTANLGAATLGFAAVQPTGSPLAVGQEPYGVAAGDFNGDGFMDIVTENYQDAGTISVLLGNGDGTFQPAVTYSVGSLPERVLVADFNGDGKPDLVVANTESSTVSILLGNGDGTFQEQVTYNVGSPVGLGVLDLNHDGFPDIAAGDYYNGTMSVLINNGDGTFQNAVTYPTSSTPQTLAEGDFNGDGNIDIVVGNLNSNTVGIFLGNGDGTFQSQVTYAVGSAPQGVQVGDFNGDGKADLAVVNSGDNTLSILLGNGDGTFQTQVTYPVGSDPVGLVIADFNGDGKQDIAVGNTAQSDLTESYLLGNGDGTFQAQIKVPAVNFPYGEAAADFNGDGLPDLAISAFNSSEAVVLLSEITQTATATLPNATITGTGTHNLDAVYAGDTNFSGSTSPNYPLVISNASIAPGSTTIVANGGVAPGSPVDYTFFGNMNVEFGDPGGGQPTVLTDFTVNTLQNVEFHGNSNYTSVIAPGGTTPFTTGSLVEAPTNYPNTTPHTTLLATFSPVKAGGFTVYILDGNTDGVYVGNSSVGLGVNGGPAVTTASQVQSGANEFTAYTISNASPSDVFQVYATTSTDAYPSIGALTFTIPSAGLAASATTLTATPSTQTVGGVVTLSVAVASSSPSTILPTGTVTLTNTSVTPNATLGTITLGAGGTGSLQTSALPTGSNSILAVYSGDSVYAASSSAPQTVTISAAAAVINAQSFGYVPVAGTPATITLTYNVPGGVTPVAALANGLIFSSQPVSCLQNVCSLAVTFTPAGPGLARDALTLRDGSGNLLDKTFLYGVGVGPQVGYDLSYGVFAGQTHTGTIQSPTSVAVGPDRNLYITDNAADKVYQVNPINYNGGTALPINGLGKPAGVAVSGDETVYVVDQTNNAVHYLNLITAAQGILNTSALLRPTGVAVDGAGAVYITDTGHGRILKIDNQGAETSLASELNAPAGIALDSAGDVFYGDPGSGGEITELTLAGGTPSVIGSNLGVVNDLAVEASGRVFFATTQSVSTVENGVVRSDGYFQFTGNSTNYGMALDQNADVITTNTSGGTFIVTARGASDFGGGGFGTPVGTTLVCCDFISNTGNAPLTVSGLSSTGVDYTVDGGAGECTAGQVVQPAQTCSVAVDFTPTASQYFGDALTLTSNSLNAAGSVNTSNLSLFGQAISTSLVLAITPNPAVTGSAITFTGTLTPNLTNSIAPTGSVQFVNADGTVFGSAPLKGLSAQLVLATLGTGSYNVTAIYSGDALYAGSTSSPQALTVAVSTSLALASVSPNSGAIGSPATTVTLTGANFSVTDVVQFNTTVLSSTYVSPTTITAILPASFFTTAGTRIITVYDPQRQMTSGGVPFIVSTSPQVVFTGPGTAVSGQQPSVNFQLVNPYPVPLTGSLTLSFTPSTSSGVDDPAVQFASGGRTLNFAIPADSTTTPAVQLQTGTVAGTAVISLALTANGVIVTPANLAPVSITIPAAAPTITSISLTRSGSTVTVSVVGFSNTREAVQAAFHFNAVPGGTIDNPDVNLTVGSDFSGWYVTPDSDAYGSAFTYNQVFTLDQDAAIVQNVTVTLSNTIGSSAPSTTP